MSVRKDKVIPDYTGDRYWANVLATRIQQFWHRLGYYKVRAWVEEERTTNGAKYFYVRSNITYNARDLKAED